MIYQVSRSLIFDCIDYLMKVDWYGPETKPVHRAAFATQGRKAELEKWLNEGSSRYGAIISEGEVFSLERLLSKKPFLINTGLYIGGHTRQQYCITINSGSRDYYLELGFSRNSIDILELIKGCLNPESRKPLEEIIHQVVLWKK